MTNTPHAALIIRLRDAPLPSRKPAEHVQATMEERVHYALNVLDSSDPDQEAEHMEQARAFLKRVLSTPLLADEVPSHLVRTVEEALGLPATDTPTSEESDGSAS